MDAFIFVPSIREAAIRPPQSGTPSRRLQLRLRRLSVVLTAVHLGMVRTGTYQRKGGHGGHRNGGLRPGHWEEQGGRVAAAAAKAKRAADAQAEADVAKRQKRAFWQQWAAPSSSQQTTSNQQQSSQPAADAESEQPAQQQPA